MSGRLGKLWRAILGYRDCPCCGERALRWHQFEIHHPDEPPMFGWWHCSACDRSTDVLPTSITEKAVKGLGYRNFDEWAEAHCRREEN